MLFSATLDGDIAKLTKQYQNDPVRHEVGEETPDITLASHVFWNVTRETRVGVTADAINAVWPAIVFCRTRHGSDRLAKQLGKLGIEAAAIHGGRSQNQRTRALKSFANNRVHALVATDVAARGIHVDGVACVIHYDPPEDFKAYTHRSGRTARAGEGGVVVSMVQKGQTKDVKTIQRKVGLKEPFIEPDASELSDLSPSERVTIQPKTAEETRNERQGGGGGGGRGKNRRSKGSGGGRSRGGGQSKQGRGQNSKGKKKPKKKRSSESYAQQGPKKKSSKRKRPKGKGPGGPKGRKGGGKGSGKGKGKKGGGPTPPNPKGNRKARRAHLQPGNR